MRYFGFVGTAINMLTHPCTSNVERQDVKTYCREFGLRRITTSGCSR